MRTETRKNLQAPQLGGLRLGPYRRLAMFVLGLLQSNGVALTLTQSRREARESDAQALKAWASSGKRDVLYQTVLLAAKGMHVPKDESLEKLYRELGLDTEKEIALGLLVAHVDKMREPYDKHIDQCLSELARRTGLSALIDSPVNRPTSPDVAHVLIDSPGSDVGAGHGADASPGEPERAEVSSGPAELDDTGAGRGGGGTDTGQVDPNDPTNRATRAMLPAGQVDPNDPTKRATRSMLPSVSVDGESARQVRPEPPE